MAGIVVCQARSDLELSDALMTKIEEKNNNHK